MSETADEATKITLDLLGFFCPVPVHETRKALRTAPSGAILEVICDDPETLHDMPALCDRLRIELIEVSEEAGEFTYLIRNQSIEVNSSEEEGSEQR